MKRPLTLLMLVLALVLSAAACGGDDDDKSASSSASESTANEDEDEEASDDGTDAEAGGSTTTTVDIATPLEPEEARREGNPAVFERIATTTDCAKLQDELEAHQENIVTRRDSGDERRASILEEYAAAVEERMAELSCPGAKPAT